LGFGSHPGHPINKMLNKKFNLIPIPNPNFNINLTKCLYNFELLLLNVIYFSQLTDVSPQKNPK